MVKFMYYVNIFFIFSFLGFLFENLWTIALHTNFNSGILYGPWTFIYGFAAFALMFLDRFLKNKNFNKWLKIILFFLVASVLMTTLEFAGGIIIEKLFHKVYWDYTNMKFNMGRYICLEVALFWGAFATLVNYLVLPHIKKLAKKIPVLITLIIIGLFIVDIVMTVIN